MDSPLKHLKLIGWNAQSLRSAPRQLLLKHFIQLNSPDVLFLVETWLLSPMFLKDVGFQTHQSEGHFCGGAAIAVKDSLPSEKMDLGIDSHNLVAMKVGRLFCLCIYFPPMFKDQAKRDLT